MGHMAANTLRPHGFKPAGEGKSEPVVQILCLTRPPHRQPESGDNNQWRHFKIVDLSLKCTFVLHR